MGDFKSAGDIVFDEDWDSLATRIDTVYSALSLDYAGSCGTDWVSYPLDGEDEAGASADIIATSKLQEMRDRLDTGYDNWCATHCTNDFTTHHPSHYPSDEDGNFSVHKGSHDTGYEGGDLDSQKSGADSPVQSSPHQSGDNGSQYGTHKGTYYGQYH